MSVIVAWCGCMFLLCSCNNNHYCFITVSPPMDSMRLLYGLSLVNTVVLLLCLPNSVMNVHPPRPDGSCPLLIMAEISVFKEIITLFPDL